MNENKTTAKLALLSISLLLTSANAVNGALPMMKKAMHLSATQSELITTISSIAVVIMVLLSATIARVIGTKRTVALGLLLVGVAGIVPMFVSNYELILVSRVALGAGFGIFNSLAVSMIQVLYSGNTRASMLGFRSSAEPVGQAVMTIIAGLLMMISWHMSFAVYLIAFPILFLFWKKAPDVDHFQKEDPKDIMQGAPVDTHHYPAKTSPLVWLFVAFCIILMSNIVAMNVRFPQITAGIMGTQFNSSNILAVMPILGIIAGMLFGWVNKHLGKGTFYLGIIIFVLADLLVAFSAGNFGMLTIGFFLSGIPGSLIIPFIFNSLPKYAPKKAQAFAASMMIVGFNIGSFLTPFFLRGIEIVLGSTVLTAPFSFLAGLMLVIGLGSVIGARMVK
ncbi:MFS transporter [Periweissella cryptocerci]|uniref:MFS transporter n=1 Tax=Periweissella cryptocerci TaxID=2506420 RepID=A0A4P6YRK0_9LACO|nr:MFS transporter [Periweissella cryptocerci]QBO35246.1 MFS transporter [Periweissella cryptocerci]